MATARDGGPIALHDHVGLHTLFTPREFFLRAGFRMLLLALAGVASEQQQIAALQQQVAAQQAQMVALSSKDLLEVFAMDNRTVRVSSQHTNVLSRARSVSLSA